MGEIIHKIFLGSGEIVYKAFFNLLIPMFALGVVVFVHELGHFLVARWCGIKVLKFSIGFGPKICTWKRGDTEYCISWIFFGGYVKFLGDELENEDAHQTEGAYYSVSSYKRILTCLAGPGMNFVFAFVVYALIFILGRPVLLDEKSTVVGEVMKDFPAEKAGLMAGDKIIKIDDQAMTGWRDVLNQIALSPHAQIRLEILRNNQTLILEVVPHMDAKKGIRMIGIGRKDTIKVGKVEASMPGEKAGLQKGDVIVGFQGHPVYQWDNLIADFQTHGAKEAVLDIERGAERLQLKVTPEWNAKMNRVLIGFYREEEFITERPNPFTAMAHDIHSIFQTLIALFARTVSPKGLSGPVGILMIIGAFAKAGFVYFLGLMAMISVNLGVFNVLPIPVLDGGHVLFNLIEIIRGKALPKKTMILVQNVFVTVLIAFILFVTYQDIGRLKFFSKSETSQQEMNP